MEDTIPCLQNLALLQVATSLWNENNILNSVYGDLSAHYHESKVLENVEKLELPQALRKRVSSLVVNIGKQIVRWLDSHEKASIPLKIPQTFYWTVRGTIDQLKTIKSLIRTGRMDVIDRYGLACFYCLESYIHFMWNRYHAFKGDQLAGKVLTNEIVAFWTLQMDPDLTWVPNDILKEQIMTQIRQPVQQGSLTLNALRGAVKYHNPVATKYFWPKLTTEEKMDIRPFFYYRRLSRISSLAAETFHSLLSSMEEDHRNRVLRRSPLNVLIPFLIRPWHDHFFHYARLCSSFYSEKNFLSLLKDVMFTGDTKYDYHGEIFEQFWMEGPTSLKESMIEDNLYDFFITLKPDDEDKVSLILKHLSTEVKERLIFSDQGIHVLKMFGCLDKWILFKRFVKECLVTVQSVAKFRKDFADSFLSGNCRKIYRIHKEDQRRILKATSVILDSL